MPMKYIFFKDIGLISYEKAWSIQNQLFEKMLSDKASGGEAYHVKDLAGHLLLCEHPHVFTLGKSGSEANLLVNMVQLHAKNAEFIRTDRGGDITYHGPGQIVGYPILNLEILQLGIKDYVTMIEEVIIQTLHEFKISAGRLTGATGVWLDADNRNARKICAIGIKASRYISMHGFAFNVNTDLSYFDLINPCGFTDKKATSLQKEIGKVMNIDEVKALLLKKFAAVFKVEIRRAT